MDLAVYAVQEATAKGRVYPEAESSSGRTPWQRDRDRVIHSTGFRVLQYKTQVFVNHEGDFFRTRLTHSLEVAQIARSIARSLQLNEDLTECLALAHDVGHPPFGHAGEHALQEGMKDYNGFSHNDQSLRQVTRLEQRYVQFDGLNLTWESLEGLAKHNGPVLKPDPYLKAYNQFYPLELTSYASAEAQIASISDDIAYHSHDLDDGLRAGLLQFDDLKDLPIVGQALYEAKQVIQESPATEHQHKRLRHEMIRRVINILVSDLKKQTALNIKELCPKNPDDIRYTKTGVVQFSSDIGHSNQEIRQFLYKNLYYHWRVKRMSRKGQLLVKELFEILSTNMDLLPTEWHSRLENALKTKYKSGAFRVVADYIAGMTDRYAMEEYQRLTDLAVLA
ncbi:dGTP triphosphohydrolase (Dgt) (PDB:6OI7) [Commensalibacter communis]|uniref:deoxyguanosinetriphosphate triphosphohydrolase n=1 Tax=Commensalibacter communis TaxID=2972786 RepID=UPI0022FFAB5B|nr:deoxyguanosinetriphosphate triphosphohydrolase [Commensalibacter communis]CAI3957639.1 dGTP triphosphohydrolase (Dgt) (PDB:6OI7) [Commensalibacter communis]CAI3958636.1 dGTP triphosphohydrolase (Dgt) (PDB:6OI7) [Commensalibacter communis]